MSVTTDEHLSAEHVAAIATEVLSSLGVETFELPEAPAAQGLTWTASVSISGAWGGHVSVSCSPATAEALTSTMLGLAAGEASQEDLADAIGELANMIGGSVKGMLPPPNSLSLPHVVLAAAGTHHWPHATPLCGVALAAPHGPLLVDVRTVQTSTAP